MKITVLLLFLLFCTIKALAGNWTERDRFGFGSPAFPSDRHWGGPLSSGNERVGHEPRAYSRYFRANREWDRGERFLHFDRHRGRVHAEHEYRYGEERLSHAERRGDFREKQGGTGMFRDEGRIHRDSFRDHPGYSAKRPDPPPAKYKHQNRAEQHYSVRERIHDRAEQGFARGRYGRFSSHFGLSIGRHPQLNFGLGWYP